MCIYIYKHVCIQTRKCIRCRYIHVYVHVYIYMYRHTYIDVQMYIYEYIYIHVEHAFESCWRVEPRREEPRREPEPGRLRVASGRGRGGLMVVRGVQRPTG